MLPQESSGLKPNGANGHHDGYEYYVQRPASLRQFVTVLFKRKSIILSLFISVVGTVTVGTFLLPPVYRSDSQIYVEREMDTEKALLLGLNLQLPYEKADWLNSESEILKSYPVTVRVIRALKLDEIDHPGKAMTEVEKAQNFERAVKKFQKTLKVEIAKNSNIIDIAYEAKDPRLAAAVVNKIVETYIQYRTELFTDSETYKFFEQQMKIADEQLRALEERQTDFKRSSEVVSPQAQTNILLSKLAEYQRSLTETQTRRIGKEAKLKIIREQFDSGKATSIPTTESSDSPSREKYIAKLKGDLLDMEVRRDRLLQKFTPEYEEVVNLTAQIDGTKKSIGSEVQQIIEEEESSIRVLQAQEHALQIAIAAINHDLRNFTEKEYQLSQLTRGIDDNKEVYSMLLKQREEARISLAKAQRGVKIRVVSPAVVSSEPVKPRKVLNIALAVFLGFVSGLGMAFFIEYFDHSLNSPEEVERYLGLPVLGAIREFRHGNGGKTTTETRRG